MYSIPRLFFATMFLLLSSALVRGEITSEARTSLPDSTESELYEAGFYFILAPQSITDNYKDLRYVSRKNKLLAFGGIKGGEIHSNNYFGLNFRGCLVGYNLETGVRDTLKNTFIGVNLDGRYGRYFKAKYGYLIPYAGLDFAIYGVPQEISEGGVIYIGGRKDVYCVKLTGGIISRWFNKLWIDYTYSNIFPLANLITISTSISHNSDDKNEINSHEHEAQKKIDDLHIYVGAGFGRNDTYGIFLGIGVRSDSPQLP